MIFTREIEFKMNFDQTEMLLNDVMNKAMCSPDRIKHPNSNTIAQFIIDYMSEKNMTQLNEYLNK